MMEYRKNGVMECWSNGVMGGEQYSNIPVLHHSNWIYP